MPLFPRMHCKTARRHAPREASVSAIERLEDRCLLAAGWTMMPAAWQVGFKDVLVQPDGKILAGGDSFADGNITLIRYNIDGTLDPSFDGDGKLLLPAGGAHFLARQEDGKILVGAYAPVYGGWAAVVIRVNPDGSIDQSFATEGRFEAPVGEIAGLDVQADGKIVLAGQEGGEFGFIYSVIRLNGNGSVDESFGDNGVARAGFETGNLDWPSFATPTSMTLQADGRIVVAGYAYTNGISELEIGLARFNSDGILDSSFGDGGLVRETFGTRGVQSNKLITAVQQDGKVLVAGGTLTGETALMRLNADGSLDGTFTGDALVILSDDVFTQVHDVLVQPNGRILLAGYSREHPDPEIRAGFALWRFNADGTPDGTFSSDGHVETRVGDEGRHDGIEAIALLPDGRIVAVGNADYVQFVGSQGAVARYRPNGTLDPTFGNNGIYPADVFEPNDAMETASNLGSGDQYLTGLTIHDPGNDDWYRWTASEDGTLTVDLLFRHDTGNLNLELYTPTGLRVGRSNTVTDNERVTRAVTAGEVYFIRATVPSGDYSSNYTLSIDGPGVREPVVSGSAVDVYGMAGDDVFTFKAGSTHVVTVNGHTFRYAASAVSTIRFHGEAGNDSLTVTGTDGDETANIQLGSLTVNGPGYRVTGDSIENVIVIGRGGNDSATLIDSPGDDRLTMKPTLSRLVGTGFSHEVRGFERVVARATSDGTDRADFFDSSGNDRVNMKPTQTEMIAPGFTNRAVGFERVIAIAGAGGGDDRAYLYDSPGDDSLKARPRQVVFTGLGFSNDARNFNRVLAYATSGGSNDQAFLHDSAGDDRLVMKSGSSEMTGPGFRNYVQAFDRVTAYANDDGTDRVDFYDSTGNDEFVGRPAQSKMTGPGFVNVANHFELVYAYATLGGTDTARLFDSGGADRYTSRSAYARMEGAGFYIDTRSFETVFATASSTNAEANLLDFATGELVSGTGSAFRADRTNRVERLSGFGRIKVTAAAGQTPQSTIDPLQVDYIFEKVGSWI